MNSLVDVVTSGFGFLVIFIVSTTAMMGMMYAMSPSLRESIKQDLGR